MARTQTVPYRTVPTPDYTSTHTRSGMFWLAALFFIAGMIPLQFEVATLLFAPIRLVLFIVAPLLIIRWLMGAYGKLTITDYAVIFFCFWMTLAIGIHHPNRVVTFAGSNVMLVMGGFVLARATIRSADDFFAMTKLLAVLTLLLMPLAIHESFYHNPSLVLTKFAEWGWDTYNDSDHCCRFGLTRSQTVFIHPLHFGIFCALAFSLVFVGLTNRAPFMVRLIVAGLLAFTCFTTVASGSLIVIFFQFLLILYTLTFNRWEKQWYWGLRGALVGYIILELNTTKFAGFTLAEKLAYSPGNVWTRQIMVDVGLDLMNRYPFFGYGHRKWPLPSWMHKASVDNYWIVIGGGFGKPALFSALLAFVWAMLRVGGNRLKKGSDLYWVRISWTILLVGLMLCMGTVYLWGPILAIVYFMLGSGMFLMYAQEPDSDGEPPGDETAETSVRSRYSRFPDGPGIGQGAPALSRTANS